MKITTISLAMILAAALHPPAFAAERKMTLDAFSKIRVNAPVDLDVAVGRKPSFTISGRDEDLDRILVEVRNDTLIIKKKKRAGRIKKVNISLALRDLTKFVINGSSDARIRDVDSPSFEIDINGSGDVVFDGKSGRLLLEINGSGDVESDNFDAQQVAVEISGSGDIALSGKCRDLDLEISGSGDFSGRELTCATARVSISGSGDAVVHANAAARISSSGSADIDIYGNPKSIENRSSGSSGLNVHAGK